MRQNRVSKKKLTWTKKFAEQERGTYEIAAMKTLLAVTWMVSGIVTVLTNCAQLESIGHMGRYFRQHKKRVDVNIPFPIKQYNKYIREVDLCDQSNYRTTILTKTWWLAIDVSCVQG